MASYNANLFSAPALVDASSRSFTRQESMLPLNLIALIISHLDDVGDLARVCQTSRVLHYMTIPQLYRNITLTSYNRIRYKDDQPEGCGSASPFSMGLNALVTRSVAKLVNSLTLQGDWVEYDLKEFSSVGRVPDASMMLNIAVRAAIDRCVNLESFRWDLPTKSLATIWGGLSALPQLKALYLRFPSSRSPRPTIEIPPIPGLESFTMTHFDPLCFPDDISSLLYHATKLTKLVMHFSPRMRDAGEPSVQMSFFFRKLMAGKRKAKIRSFGLYNLFAAHDTQLHGAFDLTRVESATFLNTFGIDEDTSQEANGSGRSQAGFQVFFDSSWSKPPKGAEMIRTLRRDRLSRGNARVIDGFQQLEKLYLVNVRHVPAGNGHGESSPMSSTEQITPSTGSEGTQSRSSSRATGAPNLVLRDLYLDAISKHGATLKHLILPARWPLPTFLIAKFFQACPRLTQLSMAMEFENFDSFKGMRMLLPFLKRIWAFRLLAPLARAGRAADGDDYPDEPATFEAMVAMDDAVHVAKMGEELRFRGEFPELRFIGIGEKVFEVGELYEMELDTTGDDGQLHRATVTRRRITRRQLADVKEVEIWKMDSLDVV